MTEEVKNLIKKTWVDYFAGYSKELIKNLDNTIVKEYVDGMNRLETDFDLQKELGIGL
jgi:hypothetical protein